MIKPENVSFPITAKKFADLQRAELGRELTPDEKELFFGVADLANEAYEAAARGDAETVQALLSAINTAPATEKGLLRLVALCRGWVLLGCQKGTEVLKATIDGEGRKKRRSNSKGGKSS